MAGLFDFGFGLGNGNWFNWQSQPPSGQPMQLAGTAPAPAAQAAAPASPSTGSGGSGYSPEMIANARYNLLAQMGMGLMAAGQPMSGAQRAQFLGQLGQLPADYQKSLAQQLEMAQKQKAYQQQQQQQQYLSNLSPEQLQKLGFSPEQATLFKGMGAPADIIEKQAFSNLGSGGNLGMELRYWTDEKGQLHAGQLMPGGGVKEVQLPPGSQWAPQTQYLDTGTGYQAAPKIGAQPGQVIPKQNEAAAAQTASGAEKGKSMAQAQIAYPAAVTTTSQSKALIDGLLTDKRGLAWATGPTSKLGTAMAGSPGYDFAARTENLKGKVFLEAFAQLRGAGAITEREEAAAVNAAVNLDLQQGTPQFEQTLVQLQQTLDQGLENLRIKASGLAQPPGATKTRTYNPQTGELE